VKGTRRKTGPADHAANAQPAEETPSASSAVSPLVLIVEDEAPIADAIALVVQEAGFTPLVAKHGRQGLEMARSRHPALIITDFMMPHMNGDALIAAIRDDAQERGVPAPPIILITAVVSQRTRNMGADYFLPKPFDIEELADLLHRFIDGDHHHTNGTQP
jgi:DNA-binding response OmpR family regulator